MLSFPAGVQVYLCVQPIDLRKSFDGLCADAEYGCEECTRPCPECRLHAGRRAKAIREEVIKAGDPDVATAWLKSIGRWRDDITSEQVMQELADAKALLPAPPGDDKGG